MKNRYCRRTKLSEPAFLMILAGYCAFESATDTYKKIKGNRYGVKVSRQTIEGIFLKIGDYIYARFMYEKAVAWGRGRHPEPDFSDEQCEQEWLDLMWTALRGDLDYEADRKTKPVFPAGSMFLGALVERNKRFRGLSEKHFRSHVGFAVFYSSMAHENRTPVESCGWLMEQLERHPL